jgi:hypothetical protein
MSLEVAAWVSALAAVILAVFAIVTAKYAKKAFLEQSKEVRDQARMLQVQSDQLAEDRKVNAEQIRVLGLQAKELQESQDERKRQAELGRSYQARFVFLTEEPFGGRKDGRGSGMIGGIGTLQPSVTAMAHNTSDQPVYDAELRWHMGSAGHGEPNPEPIGTLLPGAVHASKRSFPEGTNLEVSGAVLRFRDAAGVIWMRLPDGGLTEQV